MKPPKEFSRIVNRTRYSVQTATLLAHDAYWDGHNFERSGRNEFLYRTPNGNYFTVNLTCWQDEQNTLTPVNQDEAIDLFENGLSEHEVTYAEAFPGVEVKDA
ncbi:MAG: hypothetical protein LLG42_16480 [Chloroflexi bacterium]|nr:hypothetical protein [Chloroflexota bacterium]